LRVWPRALRLRVLRPRAQRLVPVLVPFLQRERGSSLLLQPVAAAQRPKR